MKITNAQRMEAVNEFSREHCNETKRDGNDLLVFVDGLVYDFLQVIPPLRELNKLSWDQMRLEDAQVESYCTMFKEGTVIRINDFFEYEEELEAEETPDTIPFPEITFENSYALAA